MPPAVKKFPLLQSLSRQPFPDAAGLLHVALLVRGGLGEHHTQAQFQKPRDRRRHLDAPEVQAIGAFQLPNELALHVQKCRKHSGDGLVMQRLETARRWQFVPHRGGRFPQNIPFKGRVLEGPGGGQTTGLGLVDGGFDRLDLPLPDHGEMPQALLDTPLFGDWTPVELRLAKSRGQLVGLAGNLFEYLTMILQFLKHSWNYTEGGNYPNVPNVYRIVKMRLLWAVPLVCSAVLSAADSDYVSAKRKMDSIESDRLRSGTRVEFVPAELNAFAGKEAPAGVRNPKLQLVAREVVTGSALVDFGKVRRAQGNPPGWLMSKLLDGERPVSVTVRIRSSGGRATVDVERVEISGIAIDGGTLEFLIQNVLLPLYPSAAVARPFELGHRMERLDVGATAVSVVIGR
jgi:hypothetical protein